MTNLKVNGVTVKHAILPEMGRSRSRAHDALRSKWLIAAATGEPSAIPAECR